MGCCGYRVSHEDSFYMVSKAKPRFSELVVKVVNTQDMTRVLYLREQSRPVKHVSFDHSGSMLAVSCSDGLIYFYSLSSEEPQLVKRLDGMIRILETDSRASTKALWHPDGRAFAIPTPTKGMHRREDRTSEC